MKICTKCGIEKEATTDDFYKSETCRDGLRGDCIICHNEKTKVWAKENPGAAAKGMNKYRLIHPERSREINRKARAVNLAKYRKRDREKAAKRYAENPEKCIEINRRYQAKHPEVSKKWKANNPEKVKATRKKSQRKIRSTVKGKLNHNLSSEMLQSLKKKKAGRHWESLVDYTVDQLKRHLEKLFKPGMTWENYGTVWEIDHKIPIAVFNYEHPEHIDFKLCWSLKNLQPLEVTKNRSKNAKLYEPFQPALLLSAINH